MEQGQFIDTWTSRDAMVPNGLALELTSHKSVRARSTQGNGRSTTEGA